MTEAVTDISHIYIGLTFVPLINVFNKIFRITENKHTICFKIYSIQAKVE